MLYVLVGIISLQMKTLTHREMCIPKVIRNRGQSSKKKSEYTSYKAIFIPTVFAGQNKACE